MLSLLPERRREPFGRARSVLAKLAAERRGSVVPGTKVLALLVRAVKTLVSHLYRQIEARALLPPE